MSEITVKGLRELQSFLDSVSPKIERNIIRGALRAGAKVIMQEAKANVPIKSGTLRDSIRLSVRARGGAVTASVKAGGKTKTGGDAYYANMVEFGTAAHTITAKNRKVLSFGGRLFQSVEHPGARPHPFMRPAFDSKSQEAVLQVGNYIKQRLATKQGLDTSDIEITIEDEQ